MVKINEKQETESTFRMSFMALMLKEILYTIFNKSMRSFIFTAKTYLKILRQLWEYINRFTRN